MGIPYYYTFLNGEGAATLRKYCEEEHRDSDPAKPLFLTDTGTSVARPYLLRMLKGCIRKAGMDPKTMWIHSLRKAFRKIVRQAPDVDDDDREQLMGHSIKGSRSAYYDKNDIAIMMGVYGKCNFSRKSEYSEVAKYAAENESLKKRLEQMEKTAITEAQRQVLDALSDPETFEKLEDMLKKRKG